MSALTGRGGLAPGVAGRDPGASGGPYGPGFRLLGPAPAPLHLIADPRPRAFHLLLRPEAGEEVLEPGSSLQVAGVGPLRFVAGLDLLLQARRRHIDRFTPG
ncbi:MAG: hypothetical protein ACTHO8_08465 [Solirubrobacterales bacterium]